MTRLSTKQTAERLGVTVKRVQAMIRDERLPAEKMGRDWFIDEQDLLLVADRKPGRPSKSTVKNEEEIETGASPAEKIGNLAIMRLLRKRRPEIHAMSDEEFQELEKLAKAEDRRAAKTKKAQKPAKKARKAGSKK